MLTRQNTGASVLQPLASLLVVVFGAARRARLHSCAAVAVGGRKAVILPIKTCCIDCAHLTAHLLPLLNKGHSERLTQQLRG